MAEIRVPESMPLVPSEGVNVVRLRPPAADERALRSIARRLGLDATEKAGVFVRDRRSLSYRQGAHLVRLHTASGGFRFYDELHWQVDDGEANLTLSDRQLINAGEKFLQRHQLAGREDYKLLRVARLNVASADRRGRQVEQRVIDGAVAFQRVVDGIPVDGPGGKIVVYLDQQRNVTGCERLWRDLGGIARRRVEVRPPDYALDKIKQRWARGREGRVEVDDLRFCYFELGWDDSQSLLQPAYVAIITLVAPDERIRVKKIEVIAASPVATAGLVPPRKRRVTQRPRS